MLLPGVSHALPARLTGFGAAATGKPQNAA